MRTQNVLLNTGVVREHGKTGFLGSCFAFRYPTVFLTAAHCVPKVQPKLRVELPLVNRDFEVVEAILHPTADVAVLRVPGVSENDITWPQYTLFDDRSWGTQVASCGYPEDYQEGGPQPVARVFMGHVQRFFLHKSHMGYQYLAAEMSMGAPRGLSGASIFNQSLHGRLYGVVAENIRTVTDVESVLEVQDGNQTYKELSHNVINYGVAVWLPAISDWLDSIVPPVPDAEIHRRSVNQQKLREAGLA